jgi:hypothetical protein
MGRPPWRSERPAMASVRAPLAGPHLDALGLCGSGLGQEQAQHAILDAGLDALGLDVLGQGEHPLVVAGLILDVDRAEALRRAVLGPAADAPPACRRAWSR